MGIRVAICIDERGGLFFNKRRQSRDRILIGDLMSHVNKDEHIYISEYSLPLFKDYGSAVVCNSPLNECPDNCICFVELSSITDYVDKIDELILYNWGEAYPYDDRLDTNLITDKMRLVSQTEFVGSSHEKIVKEIYR